jgi:hypothetical protein
MTPAAPLRRRPPPAVRRFGYVVAAGVNAALLSAVNHWPGWAVLPFLTPDMNHVVGLVSLSLAAGVVVNLVYLVQDPPWLRAGGDTVTAVVGALALWRLWQVFPFDFGDGSVPWALLVRAILILGLVGSAIAVIVQLRTLVTAPRDPRS